MMTERIARVLCWRDHHVQTPPCSCAAPQECTAWRVELDDARAVLEALREPTEAMVSADTVTAFTWGDTEEGRGLARIVWRAMVDVALNEAFADQPSVQSR